MRLRELVRSPAITCTPGTTLREAAHLLHLHDVGSLVVVDDDGGVVGMVTDRDLGVKGYSREFDGSVPVSRVMAEGVATIGLDVDVDDAAEAMLAHGVRRLPVLHDGRLCGVVAFDDVVQFVEKEGDVLRRLLEAQARGSGSLGWAGGWD